MLSRLAEEGAEGGEEAVRPGSTQPANAILHPMARAHNAIRRLGELLDSLGLTKLNVTSIVLLICVVLANNAIYGYVPVRDALVYLQRAREFSRLDFFNPETNWNFAPGYSAFLALSSPLTGFGIPRIAALQCVLYVAALARLFSALELSGLLTTSGKFVVTLLLLCNPNLWFPLGAVGPESLVSSLLLFTSASLLRSREVGGARSQLVSSAWMGALILVRFEWIFLPMVGSVLAGQARAKALGILLVCPALAISVNAIRNDITFGEPKLFSYGGGIVSYAGNNPNLDGSFHIAASPRYIPAIHQLEWNRLQAMRTIDFPRFIRDQDAFFTRLAQESWMEAPLDQLSVIPLKLGKLWAMPNHFDIYTADHKFTRTLQIEELFNRQRWPWYGLWKHGFYLLLHWVTLVIAAAGIVTHWRRWEHLPAAGRAFLIYVTFVIAAVCFLFAVPLYGLPRFHTPVLVLALVLAGRPPALRGPREGLDGR